jgi:hypothetical protein
LFSNWEVHRSYFPELVLTARRLANVLLDVLPPELAAVYSRSELVHAFLSFNVNAYSIGEFGVGLFFFAALASHSCSQNAACVDIEQWQGCRALRALTAIPAGAEITISYLAADLVMPTFLRRAKLLSSQLFWCQCPRCLDPTEQGRCLRGVKCAACGDLTLHPLPTPVKAPPPRKTTGAEEGDEE